MYSRHYEQSAYSNPSSMYFNWNSEGLYYSDYFAYEATLYITSRIDGKELYVGTLTGSTNNHDGITHNAWKEPLMGSNMLRISGNIPDASTAKLYYRVSGSSGPFQELSIAPIAGTDSTGAQVVRDGWYAASVAGLSGNYEMIFMALDSNGTILRRGAYAVNVSTSTAVASVSIRAESTQGSITESGFVANETGTYIMGQGQLNMYGLGTSAGEEAAFIHIRYRDHTLGGDYTAGMRIDPAAAGYFRWPQVLQGSYDVMIDLYDAQGELRDTITGLIDFTNDTIDLHHAGSVSVLQGSRATLIDSSRPRYITFSPQEQNSARLEFHYRLNGSLQDAFTTEILNKLTSGVFKLDASALDPNSDYEYYYDAFDANGVILTRNSGYFRPDDIDSNDAANMEIRAVVSLTDPDNAVLIHRRQTHNAFGEVDSETDGRLITTNFTYNTLGRMTSRIDPMVDYTLGNGFIETDVRPVTYWYYDLAGQSVGVRDANGNLNTQSYNYGTGQASVAVEWHADGGWKANGYDVYGNLRSVTEALTATTERRTDYGYDKNNRLARIDRPVRENGTHAWDAYEYDILGNRIAHSDALGRRDKSYYDSEGRVVKAVSAAGRTTEYTYEYRNGVRTVGDVQRGGFRRTITDPNGRMLVDDLDYFGRSVWHRDLGGHEFTYHFNYSGLIARQTATTGQDISYEYYANGFVRHMHDVGTNTEAWYEYDGNGNRIFEGYTAGGGSIAFQQSTVIYDVLNRLKKINDRRYVIEYEYDAVGNRRRVHAEYNDGVGGIQAIQDYWYAYDSMNRFTITMGQLSSADGSRGASATDTSVTVVRGPDNGDGVAIEYDYVGQRTQATYGMADPGNPGSYTSVIERYKYTADGLLTDTTMQRWWDWNGGYWGPETLRSRRVNDLGGRVNEYYEYEWWQWNGGGVRTHLTRERDADDTVLSEYDHLKGKTTIYTLEADGTLDSLVTSGGGEPTITTRYTYEWWDSAKQKQIDLSTSDPNQPPGHSYYTYDVNGHLKSAVDGNYSTPRAFRYWTDGDGQILQRDELLNGTFDPTTGNIESAKTDRSHRYYYLSGHRVGNVGNDGIDRIDYAQELAVNKNVGSRPEDRYRRFRPADSADFDENYQPINSQYPGGAPSRYTVRTGDTLQGIAQMVWGDSTMWYLIADANGLTGSEALVGGQVLTIPNKVTNIHNTFSTYKPYDAGKAIGDTNPTLPDPPPPPGKGCNTIALILIIVVAIVVTIFTAGAAAMAMGAVASSTFAAGTAVLAGSAGIGLGATMAAAAIGAAVGSIASQAVGVATGVQDKISWKAVATSAVTAGITAGLGSYLNGATNGWSNWTTAERAALTSVANNVVGQGVNMAMGNQDKFNWKSVAVSAIAAPVTSSLSGSASESGKEFSWGGFAETAGREVAKSAVTQAITIAVNHEGKIDWTQVAVDGFGNAIANTTVDHATFAETENWANEQFAQWDSDQQLLEVDYEARRKFDAYDDFWAGYDAVAGSGKGVVMTGDMERSYSLNSAMTEKSNSSSNSSTRATESDEADTLLVLGVLERGRSASQVEIEAAQIILRDSGYDIGNGGSGGDGVDRVWGRRTQSALREYLRDADPLGLETVQSLSPEEVFQLRMAGERVRVGGRTLPSTEPIAERVAYRLGSVARLTSLQRAENLDAVQGTVALALETHTNVPMDLVNAVIVYESGGLSNAVSGTGALGIMQMTSQNYRGESGFNPFDPDQAIPAGVGLLSSYVRTYGNNQNGINLSLAAYNQGTGPVNSALAQARANNSSNWTQYLPSEGRNYVTNIARIRAGTYYAQPIPGYFGAPR